MLTTYHCKQYAYLRHRFNLPLVCRYRCGRLSFAAVACDVGLFGGWYFSRTRRCDGRAKRSGGGIGGRVRRGALDVCHWFGIQPAKVDGHAPHGVRVWHGSGGVDVGGHFAGPFFNRQYLGFFGFALGPELARRSGVGCGVGYVQHCHRGQDDGRACRVGFTARAASHGRAVVPRFGRGAFAGADSCIGPDERRQCVDRVVTSVAQSGGVGGAVAVGRTKGHAGVAAYR